jgi:phage nucleotide-binding protein
MFKIQKPKDLASTNLKALIYGPSGKGKTYLAGSVENALVLDLEKGSASVKNKDLDVIAIENAGMFKEVLKWVKESQEASKYETIVIDSLTRYGEMLFVALSMLYPDKKDSMKLWGDFDVVSRQRLEDILSINKNIIITALEEQVSDGGILIKHPMYKANKFKMMIPSYFDFVGHLVSDNDGKRILISEPTSDAVGKNRLIDFGISTIINEDDELYNFQKIINKIKGM